MADIYILGFISLTAISLALLKINNRDDSPFMCLVASSVVGLFWPILVLYVGITKIRNILNE